jgi:hypothetical protein
MAEGTEASFEGVSAEVEAGTRSPTKPFEETTMHEVETERVGEKLPLGTIDAEQLIVIETAIEIGQTAEAIKREREYLNKLGPAALAAGLAFGAVFLKAGTGEPPPREIMLTAMAGFAGAQHFLWRSGVLTKDVTPLKRLHAKLENATGRLRGLLQTNEEE